MDIPYGPPETGEYDTPQQDEAGLTRRQFVVGAAGLAVAALLYKKTHSPHHKSHEAAAVHQPEVLPEQQPTETASHQAEKLHDFPPTFEHAGAETIARDSLALTPRGYFVVQAETMDAMTGGEFIRAANVMPIIAPGVRKYEAELLDAAAESGLPVNFLATLATIESSGIVNAQSEADARGLLQVVPRYHLDGFIAKGYLPAKASYEDYRRAADGRDSKVSYADYQKAFTDPAASLRVGANFLKSCLDSARQNQSALNPESPVIYAWAAAAYNGGQSVTEGTYQDMPQQSQLYVNHTIRLLIDVEIAARIHNQGLKDPEIVRALWSNEMNGRAYAYGKLAAVVNDYDKRAALLTDINPGIPNGKQSPASAAGHLANQAYNDYMHGKATDIDTPDHKYSIPAPPGLRIWLKGGGERIFDKVPANTHWRAA